MASYDFEHYGLVPVVPEISGPPQRILTPGDKLLEYRREPSLIRTNVHWGQRKLFLSEVEFLMKIEHQGEQIPVIYAGAAPGSHIPLLAELFPFVNFHLYDPSIFDIDPNTPRITIYQNKGETNPRKGKFFTDEDAAFWSTISVKYFITDIRSKEEIPDDDTQEEKAPSQEDVARDMEMQKQWWLTMKPILSSFKFRLPWTDRERFAKLKGEKKREALDAFTEYMEGDIYLPVWGRPTTSESRLFVKQDAKIVHYNNMLYEDQMYTFHMTKHVSKYVDYSISGIPGMDKCYDCTSEILILNELISRRTDLTLRQLSKMVDKACYFRVRPKDEPDINLQRYAWDNFRHYVLGKMTSKRIAGVVEPGINVPNAFNDLAERSRVQELLYMGAPVKDFLPGRRQPHLILLKEYENDILSNELESWTFVDQQIGEENSVLSRQMNMGTHAERALLHPISVELAKLFRVGYLNFLTSAGYKEPISRLIVAGDYLDPTVNEELSKELLTYTSKDAVYSRFAKVVPRLIDTWRTNFRSRVGSSVLNKRTFRFNKGDGFLMHVTAPSEKIVIEDDHPRINIIKEAGYALAARLVIRYQTLHSDSFCFPQECADYLYERGVRLECFASVFDARYFMSQDAKFCSLFSDLEKTFGSIGNFFRSPLDILGDWMCHPPFIPFIVEKALQRIKEVLSTRKLTIYGLFPNIPRVTSILSSLPIVKQWNLLPGTYYLEHNDEMEPSNELAILVVMSSKDTKPSEAICDTFYGYFHPVF